MSPKRASTRGPAIKRISHLRPGHRRRAVDLGVDANLHAGLSDMPGQDDQRQTIQVLFQARHPMGDFRIG